MTKSRIVTRKGKRASRGRSARIGGTSSKSKKESPPVWGALLFAGALVGLGFYGMKQAGFKRVTA